MNPPTGPSLDQLRQMSKPKLTRTRAVAALAIAAIADVVQLPITAVEATGILSIPGEGADLVVDCVVAVAASKLLGFHWVLLPSFIVEAVPGLDLTPTWTASVAYVIWQRRKEQNPLAQRVIDV
jgi:hypothetical protein